jgi:hypothetical protein
MVQKHTNAKHVKLLLSITNAQYKNCNTTGTIAWEETALAKIDNAALLDMLK